jgi:hypothetical protein
MFTTNIHLGFVPSSMPFLNLNWSDATQNKLVLAMLQMYIEGVSTRKVRAITEALCGLEVSKSQVSALTSRLDAEIAEWRQRRRGGESGRARRCGHQRDTLPRSAGAGARQIDIWLWSREGDRMDNVTIIRVLSVVLLVVGPFILIRRRIRQTLWMWVYEQSTGNGQRHPACSSFADRVAHSATSLPQSTEPAQALWLIFRSKLLKIFQNSSYKGGNIQLQRCTLIRSGAYFQEVIIIDSNCGPRGKTSNAFYLSLLSTQALYCAEAKQPAPLPRVSSICQ